MERREADGVEWLAAELPGAEVAFTTRIGGVSAPPFDSLNLGFHTGDAAESVAANRRRLCAALGIEIDSVLSARQVHGSHVQVHDRRPAEGFFARDAERFRQAAAAGAAAASQTPVAAGTAAAGAAAPPTPVADGQVTTVPGLVPLVLVADCLPIALVGPGDRPRLAMLHCGWRPLVAGIIARRAAAAGAVAAAIGPGIGPCCFEVGDEVRAAFAELDLGPGLERGRNLDLPEIAARLLHRAGVEQVLRADLCTYCHADRFYSYRRDGAAAGRQAGLAWLTCDDT